MKIIRPLVISLVLTGLAFGISAWAAGPLGDTPIASHYGPNGPDHYAPASSVLWWMPGLMAGLTVLLAALPALMPKNGRLERSSRAYETVWLLTLGLLLLTHGALVAAACGWPVAADRLIPAGVGVLMIGLGNLLGKVRYNYVFGVRTPWTLASERVWDRTHRFIAPWMMAWGVAIIVCAFFFSHEVMGMKPAMLATTAGGVGLAVLSLVYSYLAARRTGAA